MNLCDQVRAADTKRWVIVRTVKDQSVSEHSHLVALIAMRICVLLARPDLLPLAAAYACIHDLDEVITGDIPSPTKRRMDEETISCLGMYTAVLSTTYGLNMPEVKDLVKVAERLEEAWFIRENSAGTHATQVQVEILERLYEDLSNQESPPWLAARKVWDELVYGTRYW